MIHDKRGQRRRFIYGEPRESRAASIPLDPASMPIKQADPHHPLLKPGECRVEGGAIMVRAFRNTAELGDPYRDPMGGSHRWLVWLSVEMAHRYREGMAAAIKLGLTK